MLGWTNVRMHKTEVRPKVFFFLFQFWILSLSIIGSQSEQGWSYEQQTGALVYLYEDLLYICVWVFMAEAGRREEESER